MPDGIDQYQGTELKEVFRDPVFLVDLPDGPGPKRDGAAEEAPRQGKKKWFLNTEDKDRVREKYLAGMEMEDISKDLNLGLTAISRYVDEEGLGKERYKGQPVPDKGSAQVPSATAFG